MKVYIIYSGEYSDRCIAGVFSTKEKAQAYIDERAILEDLGGFIHEEEVDPEVPKRPNKIYMWAQRIGNRPLKFNMDGEVGEEDEESIEIDGFGDESWESIQVHVNYNPNLDVMKKAALDRYYMLKAEKEGL